MKNKIKNSILSVLTLLTLVTINSFANEAESRIERINAAESEISAEYFTEWDSEILIQEFEYLEEASRRGVKVRIIAKEISAKTPEMILSILSDMEKNKEINPSQFEVKFRVSESNGKNPKEDILIIDGDSEVSLSQARKSFMKRWDSKVLKGDIDVEKLTTSKKTKTDPGSSDSNEKGIMTVVDNVYATVGISHREQAWNGAIGYNFNNFMALEAEYINAGVQPEGFNNINRVVNIDIVGRARLMDRLVGFGKLGLTSAYFSYNGFNDYEHDKGFVGHNIGLGLEYEISKKAAAQFEFVLLHYQQTTVPYLGSYGYYSFGLNYDL